MKKMTKILCAVMALVLAVGAGVGGTLAWLTDKTEMVQNTFTIGNIDIELDEAAVDAYGEYLTDETNRRMANEYKMIPGHTYKKDPTVHVIKGSEPCYLVVRVDSQDFVQYEDASGSTIAKQLEANGWKALGRPENALYYYDGIVDAREGNVDKVLFNTITLSGTAVGNDAKDTHIAVTAFAVQSEGFDDAAAAWAASGFSGRR